MKIVLTGVAGFIGSNLADKLLKDGHEIIGIDNFLTGIRRNIENLLPEPNFKFIEHDVIFPLTIEGDIDWVMHFASPASPPKYLRYPIETMRVNSEGTMHMINLARYKNASFFLASTSEIYGDPCIHPQPESYYGNVNPIGMRSCYDEAKRYAESMAYSMNRSFNVPIRVVRIFNTFGPRMDLNDGRVITNFIKQILENTPLTIYGTGKQTRSFQYIDDLVDGIVRLMNTEYYQPVNLGNPEEYNVLEIAELIKDIMQCSIGHEFCPLPEDDPKRRKPDISIARSVLGWEPKIKLGEALKRTIKYYQNNNLIYKS